MHQRSSIEFSEDLNRQPELAPGRLHQAMFGYGSNQISAEQNDRADTAVDDLFAGFDGVDALLLWRVDAE